MHTFTKSFIAGKPTRLWLVGQREQLCQVQGDSSTERLGEVTPKRRQVCQQRVGNEGRECASRSSRIECCCFWVIILLPSLSSSSLLPSHVQGWSSSSGLLSRGGIPPLPQFRIPHWLGQHFLRLTCRLSLFLFLPHPSCQTHCTQTQVPIHSNYKTFGARLSDTHWVLLSESSRLLLFPLVFPGALPLTPSFCSPHLRVCFLANPF